jgi:hypothetical protein
MMLSRTQEFANAERTDDLKDRRARYHEIKIRVVAGSPGETISIPVWFVAESRKLCLFPMQGSDTLWFKNVLKIPAFRIAVIPPDNVQVIRP